MDMTPDATPAAAVDPVKRTQPFEPDGRLPSDFATVSEFIASGAFDEAVLRAAARGVELAVARQKAQDAGGPSKGE